MPTDITNEPPALERASRLRMTIAVLVSLLASGAGHVVLGYPARGFKWFVSVLPAGVLFVVAVMAGQPLLAWVFAALTVIVRLAGIVDTFRFRTERRRLGNLKTVLMLVLMGVLGNFMGEAALRLVRADSLPTDSMYPTIEGGDHVMTSRILGTLHRGDLIVFDYPLDPTKRYLKRIVALGGDTIEIRQGQIILNGEPVERLASGQSCGVYEKKCTIRQETLDGKTYRVALLNDGITVDRISREFGPVTIPEGQVFVLGDNRDNSADSRYWGNVPVELITAKPKFVYWPWTRINQRVE